MDKCRKGRKPQEYSDGKGTQDHMKDWFAWIVLGSSDRASHQEAYPDEL